MEKKYVHLIKADGERVVVPMREYNTPDSQMRTSGDMSIDLEWYFSHGYMTIEDARREIENQLPHK